MFELPDIDDLEEVVINEETVRDSKKPVYVFADKKKKKGKDKDKEEKEPEAAAT